MIFGSVCSGVEAASIAWEPLGWKASWFSQFDPDHNYKYGPDFPSKVLAHRFPEIPNLGDMTKIQEREEYRDRSIELLVGGTPCQSFSVAGLRKGLDDDRGNLALKYCQILVRKQPRWFVWENVPGVLSNNGGRDFASIIRGFRECGYGFAYRILDAQYFGVPQRRRRVFVVGYLGDWRPAAAVLFERKSVLGYPAPSREKGQGITHDVAPCLTNSGRGVERSGDTRGQDPVIAVSAHRMVSFGEYETDDVASALKARDFKDATDLIAFSANDYGNGAAVNISPTIRAMNGARQNGGGSIAIAHGFKIGQGDKAGGIGFEEEKAPTLTASESGSQKSPGVLHQMRVRRLTPKECERLQGFPDDYTKISEKTADAPRYKAMGNSMAVPVMRWIGERIQMFEDMKKTRLSAGF